MPRDTQSYTRWTNDPLDDDDEGTNRVDEPLEQRFEDYNEMQEGRRVLAMMTPKNPEGGLGLTRLASARLLCTMALIVVVCLTGGALVGYIISSKSHPSAASLQCPAPSTTTPPASSLPPTTTTTTTTTSTTTTTTSPPETPEFDMNVENISSISTRFLSHLTPSLIKSYVGNLSSVGTDEIRTLIQDVLKRRGFTVEQRVFPVISSLADELLPNTVEIVYHNDTAETVNNATDSLTDFNPFSGFSPNGSVNGPLVYAHFASREDFETLEASGIDVNGSILLVRLGEVHPGVQVRAAEQKGAIGVILYPDPMEFGGTSPLSAFPDGDALPQDGVVWQNLRVVPGDPSTPNYASQKEVFRIPAENYTGTLSIPVQPVSSQAALSLLRVLNGTRAPVKWTGLLGTVYRFGSTFEDDVAEVRLTSNNKVEQDYAHVIYAYLPAKDHSKVIHLGCHYEIKDGHLTSSGLGLASLLALGDALETTYPNGTERLMALTFFEGKDGDFSAGHEYSQLYSWWMESTALAYIDLDSVVEGVGFMEANVSPILRQVARESFHHVAWAGQQEALSVNQGLLAAVPFRFARLFNNSKDDKMQKSFEFSNPYECDESVNFVDSHAIPSIQLTAVSLNKSNSFHLRNSQYDTMGAVMKRGDKDLHWTHMIVSTMSVAALTLSSIALPPIGFDEVGYDLSNAWKTFVSEEAAALNMSSPPVRELTEHITMALDKFTLTCESYDTWYKKGNQYDEHATPEERFRKTENRLTTLMQFGRRFLRPRSAPLHAPFGSLMTFGPSPDDPCQGVYFPVARLALKEAVAGRMSWDVLREELSLLLSAFVDIRGTIGH